MTPYIVLWKDGGRFGSVEYTEENLAYLQAQFVLFHIQTDASGTVHYNVLAPRKAKHG